MKKVLKSCCLLSFVFAFLIILLNISFEKVAMVFALKFVFNMLKFYFSIVGFILVFKNLDVTTNNKANMLGICSMLGSMMLMISLTLYMSYGQYSSTKMSYALPGLFNELFEIIFLYICTVHINEYCNLKKWVAIVTTIFIGISMLFFVNFPLQSVVVNLQDSRWLPIGIGLVMGMLALLAFRRSYEKIKKMPLSEGRFFKALYVEKILLNILLILMELEPWLSIKVLVNVLQLLFYVIIYIYIQECNLSITWRKINLDVIDKREEVNRGEVENSMLTACAKEINQMIEEIDGDSKKIEAKMVGRGNRSELTYISKIEKNCNRLLKLSGNILQLKDLSEGYRKPHFRKVDLSGLIGNIIESIEPSLKQKEISMQYINSNKAVICDVDCDAIERIVLNLVSNSIKYNKKEGSIKIFLSERKQSVCFSIQDTGIGIPEDCLMTIFKRYERIDSKLSRQQEGSGLGLAIVKTLVDMHHGEIEIKSRQGKGTLISVILPKWQGQSVDISVDISVDTSINVDESEIGETQELLKKIQVELSDLGV